MKFQNMLSAFFNGGWFSNTDGLLSVFVPGLVYRQNAKKLIKAFKARKPAESTLLPGTVFVPPYDGKNEYLVHMAEILKPFEKDLLCVIVHGSLATDEQIHYSDFDGLIIIRDDVFNHWKTLSKLAVAVHSARRVMHRIDPLQHHGWFILTESDLNAFPVTYFPTELLSFSKSILPSGGIQLTTKPEQNPDYYSPVKRMCRRIRKMTQVKNRPETLYQLKSLLSEFMLLPALYIQARDRRGIFKKLSFDAAAADFNPVYWKIMHEVSQIRLEWPAKEELKDTVSFSKIGYIWMKIRKKGGPAIPANFAKRLNDDFYNRMAELANQVEVNLFR